MKRRNSIKIRIVNAEPRAQRQAFGGPYRRLRLSLSLGLLVLRGPGFLSASSARDLPPPAPVPSAPVLATPVVRTLPNGLEVIVVERHDLPLVTLHLLVKSGAAAERAEPAGTAQFVASMLDQGTKRLSAREIADRIDGVGGTVDTDTGWDDSSLVVSVLAPASDLAFDLVADMAMHSTFPPDQVERMRRRILSALDVLRDDPSHLADAVFNRIVFADTPYGRPADGTLESVSRITRDDLEEFYGRSYGPANAVLAVAGDMDSAEAFREAARYFGSWAAHHEAEKVTARAATPSTDRIVVIDKPDAVQTEIRIGNRGISRSSPDYDALSIANQILGGPASNRLFSTLRSEHGLAYGASSDLVCYRGLGSWVAKTSTRTSETMRTVRLVLDQMRRLRDHPLSADEIATAQDYLIGHEALEFETTDGITEKFLKLLIDGLPLGYWNDFPAGLRASSNRAIWEATRRHLDPDDAVMVLVGDAAQFSKGLQKLGSVRIIPLARLDLNAPNLEK